MYNWEYNNEIPGTPNAIGGLTTVKRSKEKPANFMKLEPSLNTGNLGPQINLCYRKVDSQLADFIGGINVFAGDTPDFPIQEGYVKINQDLNEGACGKYIYLCYRPVKAHAESTELIVTDVMVISGCSKNTYPDDPTWIRIDQDCNDGAFGEYVYICYKAKFPDSIATN